MMHLRMIIQCDECSKEVAARLELTGGGFVIPDPKFQTDDGKALLKGWLLPSEKRSGSEKVLCGDCRSGQ